MNPEYSSPYFIKCEIEEECGDFIPPHDISNLPDFLNTSRKWTEVIYTTDCIHKFADIVNKLNSYDIPIVDNKKIVTCLAEDLLDVYGFKSFFESSCLCGL